ncbi:UBX domain-containing protein 4-like isoform X2 [Daktulosphaira vitifoliae]|uniref:UBX domain-containing protein 4-like isoform X2 n=1 Tax=Daktulosphaira vitifoliae TaxID=58002 RepID=UPI0021AAC811|nr:UBX domain-containing protein 4-like isoform X2 [Daktulosphaira vitifoliae]
MSRINWFDGESKDALQIMIQKNCVFVIYIGKDNDEIFNIFEDSDIIELLNNEIIICFKMDPISSSFDKFKVIFHNIDIPSVYVLEKNNTEQRILKKSDIIHSSNYQISLKRDLLLAIKNSINDILDNIYEEIKKKKYLEYLEKIDNRFMFKDISIEKNNTPTIADTKKFVNNTKIKFIIPSKNISLIHEFKTTTLLKEIKSYAINNISLPSGPIKFIAHRHFTEEDFHLTLSELCLCPSSTIYLQPVPSISQKGIMTLNNYFTLLVNFFQLLIIKPYHIVQNYVTSYFRNSQSIESKNKSTNPNINSINESKFVYKRSSNVHSLKDQKKKRRHSNDNDDNNTYNGNSTQQL